MSPLVSIVIRAKNEERFIGQTLDALFCQEAAFDYEIIVIDSGSTDRTLEIVRKYEARLVEIEPKSFSFGGALNLGANLAKSEIVINLSAHCIPTNEHWMKNLVFPILSGNASATYGRQEPIIGLNPFEEQQLLKDFSPVISDDSKVIFSNSNAAVMKALLLEHPFDEKVSFAEDFIWAKHLPTSHIVQYVNSASVFHSHPLSLAYWKNRYFDSGMAEKYIELVCGLQWPWSDQSRKSGTGFLGRIIDRARTFFAENAEITSFLLRQGYYRHIFVAPLFVFLRKYYYRKGTERGIQLFSKPTT